VAKSEDPSAVLVDIEPNSCVFELREGELAIGEIYLMQGMGLSFCAGRIAWMRGTEFGLFFKNPIHQDSLRRLRGEICAARARFPKCKSLTLKRLY
jgi:hypothetical protein